MRKNILGILAFVMAFVMIGSVSAAPAIDNSINGEFISGNFLIEWNSDGVPDLNLQYAEKTCATVTSVDWKDLATSMDTSQESFLWKTGSKNGNYCLRLYEDPSQYTPTNVIIDNIEPIIEMFDWVRDGKESDTMTDLTKSSVDFYAVESNLDSCIIEWDDGQTTNCIFSQVQYDHQYGDNKNYNVEVTITDKAGNSASDKVTIKPVNVAPTIVQEIKTINGRNDVAFGQAVTFDAIADDVEADLNAKLTCRWTFDKGASGSMTEEKPADSTGKCEVTHTWTHASKHTVDLTVKDKDGGSVNAEQFVLEVVEPIHMTPLQEVVIGNEFVFALDSKWTIEGNGFQTDFSTDVNCEEVNGAESMDETIFTGTASGTCLIDWEPTSVDAGENQLVIIRVSDASDDTKYKYYSFDLSVYTWGIHLNKGWNLISIPYMPIDPNISEVFASIIDKVAYEGNTATVLQYDAVENKWYKAKLNAAQTKFTGTLQNIVPGYGYWVKMSEDDFIYGVQENFKQDKILMPSISLATQSWNLVGRYGNDPESLPISTAFESLQGYYYPDRIYQSTEDGNSYTLANSIGLGKGYWVRTKILPEGLNSIPYEPLCSFQPGVCN